MAGAGQGTGAVVPEKNEKKFPSARTLAATSRLGGQSEET
jgi:hypothetical protein